MAEGNAVSLVTFADGKARISLPVMNSVLDAVDHRPFALYSINGNKRTGKSFMLNYFLRYLTTGTPCGDWMSSRLQNEFHWQGGSVRDTTGINIWSVPFILKVGGKEVAVLLMDTQGSFDDETTLTQNATVFALSTLLSSVLTFNVQNDVGEDCLQFLQFFSNYAIMAASESEEGLDEEQFQKLVFLIRDFSFSDYKYGYYDSQTQPSGQSKNFKREKLDAKMTQPPEIRYVHEQIVSSYGDVGAYLMPDPGKEVKRDSRTDKMDPEFREHVKTFVELMLSPGNLVTKKVGGHEVTGTQFKRYVEVWARLFRGNELPDVKSIYLTAADTQYMIAKSIAKGFYNTEMKKFLADNPQGVAVDILENKRDNLISVSSEMFHKVRKLGGSEYKDKFKDEFPEEINQLYAYHFQMNQSSLDSTAMKERMELEKMKFDAELKKQSAIMRAAEKRNEAQLKEMNRQIAAGDKHMGDLKNLLERQAVEKANQEIEIKNVTKKVQEMTEAMEIQKQNAEQTIRELRAEANKKEKGGFWDSAFGQVLGTFANAILPPIISKVFKK